MCRISVVDAAFHELRARGLDVGDDEVRASVGARRRVGEPDPDSERARGAWRGDSDDAELVVRLVIDVEVEAALLDVEVLGTFHVRSGGSFPAAPRGGGKNFFAGGPTRAIATATQRINVAGSAAEIDAGGVTARLSALIGGYLDRADSGRVTATFLSAKGRTLGRLTIGPAE